MRIIIRKFKESDIEAISRINQENWKHEFKNVYSKERINKSLARWAPEKALNRLKRRLKNKWYIYVGVYANQVVGFIIYHKEKNKIRVFGLYVDRKKHRKGIGYALLRFMEKRTKAKNYSLVSASRKETLKFYEKMGYRRFRTIRHKKTGDIDVVMIKRK